MRGRNHKYRDLKRNRDQREELADIDIHAESVGHGAGHGKKKLRLASEN